jgi:TrmH family RNA methyltransferase
VTFGVRFVLIRPRAGGNVGAAARALKNFGHRDWCIVDGEPYDAAEARMMAVQSEDVLAAARHAGSFEEAVADCAWVVGTSPRGRKGARRLRPRDWAREAAQRLGAGPVALVFGEERSGLSNDDLDRCHDVSAIPTDDAQPSMNLAQALMLYAYELRLALDGVPSPPLLPLGATETERTVLEATLGEVLGASGFLRHDPRPALRGLMDTLERGRLTRDEARLWTAALKSLVKVR